MTLPPDDRDILDRISAALAAEAPHLTGMFRVFSRLTVRDQIPDEDAVRRLPRRLASAGGSSVTGGQDASGPWRRGREVLTGRQARIMALPALLLAILITIVAFTTGGRTHCTRAVSMYGVPGVTGASCRNGAAAPPPTNR